MKSCKEKLQCIDEYVDASRCSGKLEVVITLDELHKAYKLGYDSGVTKEFDESAPVMVSKFKYVVVE